MSWRVRLCALAVSAVMAACSWTSQALALDDRPTLVRKAPYVIFSGDDSSMDVHWQLYSTATCTLRWGTDETFPLDSALSTEYGDDHQHRVRIKALDAGGLYVYRVSAGEELYEGTFRAAPEDDATQVKFLVYGDTRTYPADHDSVARAMVDLWSLEPSYQTVVIHLGDMVQNGDYESYWDAQFFDPAYAGIQELLGNAALQACMGNHEASGVLFQKYFPYPFVGGRYWSFDYGPAHFVVVDQYTDYSPGSAQLNWIESDLSGTAKPWKFVCLHEPGWSSGGGHENNVDVQQYIQPLCEHYEVAIVFAGHNHYYARASVSGVEHITSGGGGAPLRDPATGYPFIVTAASAFHFCKISIDGSELGFEAVTPDGDVLDAFELQLPLGVDQDAPLGRLLVGTSPNPFSSPATFSFDVPDGAGRVELAIYDVGGRLVRTLVDAAMSPGPASAVWDGRDAAGRAMASGVYFFRLRVADEVLCGRLTLVR